MRPARAFRFLSVALPCAAAFLGLAAVPASAAEDEQPWADVAQARGASGVTPETLQALEQFKPSQAPEGFGKLRRITLSKDAWRDGVPYPKGTHAIEFSSSFPGYVLQTSTTTTDKSSAEAKSVSYMGLFVLVSQVKVQVDSKHLRKRSPQALLTSFRA